MKIRLSLFLLPLFALGLSCLFLLSGPAQAQKAKEKEQKTYSLFDGKTLKGWKVTDFGGQGEVETKKKQILIPLGQDMSGITYDPKTSPLKFDLPKENYEISLEAMRVDGSDFFCGMTFPVGDEFCSLILGGWGGGVVGLSSIHGFDASENDTTQYIEFENKKWYKIRLRVTTQKISVWLDDKQIIDLPRKDNEFSIRFEMELSKPLGFATWQTIGALRNISLTLLEEPAAEEPATEKAADEEQAKPVKDKPAKEKPAGEKTVDKKQPVEKPAAPGPEGEKQAFNAADEGDNEPSPSDRPIESSPSDRPIETPQPEIKPDPAEAIAEEPAAPEAPVAGDVGCATLPAAGYAAPCYVQTSCCETRCKVRYRRGCRSFRRCR